MLGWWRQSRPHLPLSGLGSTQRTEGLTGDQEQGISKCPLKKHKFWVNRTVNAKDTFIRGHQIWKRFYWKLVLYWCSAGGPKIRNLRNNYPMGPALLWLLEACLEESIEVRN